MENTNNTQNSQVSSVSSQKIPTNDSTVNTAESINDNNLWKNILKNIILVLSIIFILSFIWVKIDINEDNKYLKLFGIDINTGSYHKYLNERVESLEIEKNEITFKIDEIQNKLDNKIYTKYEKEIAEIKNQQINWFDKEMENGEINLGILNSPNNMIDYFNSRAYQDEYKIINGTSKNIILNNSSITREKANISVGISETFGKVFYLANEFVDMMNSFPFWENGNISNFVRSENDLGEDLITFSISLDRQNIEEIDIQNQNFANYLKWLSKQNIKK